MESLFGELAPRGVLLDGSHGEVESTDWGTSQFETVDLDGNLLIFFGREQG